MTAPLLYVWGDDDLLAGRAVADFAAELAAQAGTPLERWDLRAEPGTAGPDAARLRERLATPTMFGGGTLAVITNPGALVRRNDTRDQVVEAIRTMADGNGLAVIEATRSSDRRATLKRLVEPVTAAGGRVVQASAPRPTSLGAWITDEARGRNLALAPGAARALAERLGSRVTEGDVDRRFLSRIALGELDKLALRHARDDGPITADDVTDLVAATAPASVWAMTDAVGERRLADAMTALDRLLDGSAEPVILAVLHRRIVELIELGDRLASGAKLAEAGLAMGIRSDFRAKKLADQAQRWTIDELTRALAGVVVLDALVKGAPGIAADAAQRRLAFVLWIRRHVPRGGAGRAAG